MMISSFNEVLSSEHRLANLAAVSFIVSAVSWYFDSYGLFNVCFSVLIISLGLLIKDNLIRGRFDISYGFYLFAFPVQQVLINKTNLAQYQIIFLSITITALLAILSWVFVESPVLRWAHSKSSPKN